MLNIFFIFSQPKTQSHHKVFNTNPGLCSLTGRTTRYLSKRRNICRSCEIAKTGKTGAYHLNCDKTVFLRVRLGLFLPFRDSSIGNLPVA